MCLYGLRLFHDRNDSLADGTLRLTVFPLPILTGHIHQDKPDVDICPSFLVGRCHSGLRCRNHHCSLPYHWQYMDPSSRKWKSFGVKDDVALEKLYCDVRVEKRDHFKPAQVLELSLTYPKRQVI